MRRCLFLLPVLLALTSCSSGSTVAGPSPSASATVSASPTPSADPTYGPVLNPPVPAALATPDRYGDTLVAAHPLVLWPFTQGALAEGASVPSRPAGFLGLTTGPLTSVPGPTLTGGAPALGFDGATLVRTNVVLGLGTDPAWSVEFWFRSATCPTTYGRIGSNTRVGKAGREGIDVFRYPTLGRIPCAVGAELWKAGKYLGGCSTMGAIPLGVWQHYVITRSATRTSCFVNGALVSSLTSAPAGVTGESRWGWGASATGYGAERLFGDLAYGAIYGRVLPSGTIKTHASG